MIRFAQIEDIPSIMTFIDMYWKKDHILAKDRSVFDYMYVRDDCVNMVISIEGNTIDGILGFVKYSDRNICLALWKTLKSKSGMLGLMLYDYLIQELKPNRVATAGVNPDTTKTIYEFLGFTFGKMNHYYRLLNKDNYNIASINKKIVSSIVNNKEEIVFKRINNVDELKQLNLVINKNAFTKDYRFIETKYFNCPKYIYELYLIEKDSRKLIVVLRKQDVNDSCCYRIVDMLGEYELLKYSTYKLEELANKENCEYIDCYCCGVEKQLFTESGFEDIEDSDNIIPEYFYPFERRNIDIYYCAQNRNQVLFKGDGDMDRPN